MTLRSTKRGMKLYGSRAQVMHGTALRTLGGLTKKNLKYNKRGKIVSRKASRNGKNSEKNNLVKNGWRLNRSKKDGMRPHRIGE